MRERRHTEEWEKSNDNAGQKRQSSSSQSKTYAIYTSIYVNFIDRSDTMVVTYCCICMSICNMAMDEFEFECLCVCTFIRSSRSIHKHIPFIFVDQIHYTAYIYFSYWLTNINDIGFWRWWWWWRWWGWYGIGLDLCLYEFEYTQLECPITFRRKSFGIVVNLFCMHVCECEFLCAIRWSFFAPLPIGIIVTCCSIWFNTCD